VPLLAGAEQISMGGSHSCALFGDGGVGCWGDNSFGQLGVMDAGIPDSLVQVPLPEAIASLSAGGTHTCAISAKDNLYCWGDNTWGELGSGGDGGGSSTPTVVASAWAVAAGTDFTCALATTDGGFLFSQVECWGRNTDGQLGDGTLISRSTPAPIQLDGGFGSFDVLVAGRDFACASLYSSQPEQDFCWGNNQSFQAGQPELGVVALPSALPGFVYANGPLFAGAQTGCAFAYAGPNSFGSALSCWGIDDTGMLALVPEELEILHYPAPTYW
jgi:alpha-tubulin suppressor-like RCC1 family protein